MGKVVVFVIILAIIAVGLTVFKQTSKNPAPAKSVTSTLSPSPTTQSTSSKTIVPKTQVIATNLEVPWALAFLPDGNILFTERKGVIKLIDKDGKTAPKEIAKINVSQNGESGLHGIALHHNFSQNHFVYIYYTYSAGPLNSLNRVSRFTFDGNNLKDEQIIVDKIPAAIFHDGGRIKFGPDKYLYITTGDATKPSLSQDKSSLAGKILRMTDEGKGAPGNPFDTLIYSLGHRNPQGIAWDDTGRFWETEHGQTAQDEVNLIEAGKNYGWPEIRGDQTKEDMVPPKIHSGSSTWAPAGTAFFNGSIYFGGLRGQALYEVELRSSQVKLDNLELKEHFKGEFGRIRDVVLGPDNMLYITTSNRDGRGNPRSDDDKIIRVDPNQL